MTLIPSDYTACHFVQKHEQTQVNSNLGSVFDFTIFFRLLFLSTTETKPTALFHLIDMLADKDCPRPAAIFAFPVGFIGAAESKAYLIEKELGIPFITLKGRMGGSALAAAAVNAVLIGDSS